MNKKYTIKDIAQLAGVSKGTVDRVLHNRGKVSSKALENINRVLSEIDYQPNLIARNLKNNKTLHLCVILPDPEKDPFWAPCLTGIEQAIKEFKMYSLVIEAFYFDPNSTASFLAICKEVLALTPNAVLLAPLFHQETKDAVADFYAQGIRVTVFNTQVESDCIQSFVGQDLYLSGRVAAKLMNAIVDTGEIFIVHLDETYQNAVHMQEKEKGFRAYFDEKQNHGLRISTLILESVTIEKQLTQILSTNPNIVGFFVTTSKAYQVAKIVKKHQYKGLRIIGYDLIAANIEYLNDEVIEFLIHQKPKEQVYLAINALVENFLFEKNIPSQKFLPIDIINTENASFYID